MLVIGREVTVHDVRKPTREMASHEKNESNEQNKHEEAHNQTVTSTLVSPVMKHRRWKCQWRRDLRAKRHVVKQEDERPVAHHSSSEEDEQDDFEEEAEEEALSDSSCLAFEDSEHTEAHGEDGDSSMDEGWREDEVSVMQKCASCGVNTEHLQLLFSDRCNCLPGKKRCEAVHAAVGTSHRRTVLQKGSWIVCQECCDETWKFVLQGRHLQALNEVGVLTPRCREFQRVRRERQTRERARGGSESDEEDEIKPKQIATSHPSQKMIHSSDDSSKDSSDSSEEGSDEENDSEEEREISEEEFDVSSLTDEEREQSSRKRKHEQTDAVDLRPVKKPLTEARCEGHTKLRWRRAVKTRNGNALVRLSSVTPGCVARAAQHAVVTNNVASLATLYATTAESSREDLLQLDPKLEASLVTQLVKRGERSVPMLEVLLQTGMASRMMCKKLFHRLAYEAYHCQECQNQVDPHRHQCKFRKRLGRLARFHLATRPRRARDLQMAVHFAVRKGDLSLFETLLRASGSRRREAFEYALGAMVVKRRVSMLERLDDKKCDNLFIERSWLRACRVHVQESVRELSGPHATSERKRRVKQRLELLDEHFISSDEQEYGDRALLDMLEQDDVMTFAWFVRRTESKRAWPARCVLLRDVWPLKWWAVPVLLVNGLLACCVQGEVVHVRWLVDEVLLQHSLDIEDERQLLLLALQLAVRHLQHALVALLSSRLAFCRPCWRRARAEPTEQPSPEAPRWDLREVQSYADRVREASTDPARRIATLRLEVHTLLTRARACETKTAMEALDSGPTGLFWQDMNRMVMSEDCRQGVRCEISRHPMLYAVLWGDVQCLEILLTAHDWQAADECVWELITRLALMRGNVAVVRVLQKHVQLCGGCAALDVAVLTQNLPLIQFFTELGMPLVRFSTQVHRLRKHQKLLRLPRLARFCIADKLAAMVANWCLRWAPQSVAQLVAQFANDGTDDDFSLVAALEDERHVVCVASLDDSDCI